MKLANSAKVEGENQVKIRDIQAFIEELNTLGQKLTDNEAAFYLGFEKDEMLALIKEDAMLGPMYDAILLKIKTPTTLERKTQNSSINKALVYIYKEDSYDSVTERAGLSREVVRVRINENDELFKRTIENGLYPPDIYPECDIEKQDDAVMDALLEGLRYQKQLSIEQLAQKAGLYPGVV